MASRADPADISFARSWLQRHRVQVRDWATATGAPLATGAEALATRLALGLPGLSTNLEQVARLRAETLLMWVVVRPELADLRRLSSAAAFKFADTLRRRTGIEIAVDLIVESTLFRAVQASKLALSKQLSAEWLRTELRLEVKRHVMDCWQQQPEQEGPDDVWARMILEVFRVAADRASFRPPLASERLNYGGHPTPLGSGLLKWLQLFADKLEQQLLPLFGTTGEIWRQLGSMCERSAAWAYEDLPGGATDRPLELAREYLVSFLIGAGVRVPSEAVTPPRNIGRIRAADAVCLWLAWHAEPRPVSLGQMWEDIGAPANLLPPIIAEILDPKAEEGWVEHFLQAGALVRRLCLSSSVCLGKPWANQHELAGLLCRLDADTSIETKDRAVYAFLQDLGATGTEAKRCVAEERQAGTPRRDLLTWIVGTCVERESQTRVLNTDSNNLEVHLSRVRLQLGDKLRPQLFEIVDGVQIW